MDRCSICKGVSSAWQVVVAHSAGQTPSSLYSELRKLAAAKLAQERPGQTLDATALVHEAYLRLVGKGDEAKWDHRGHFFAAAAEAMRRIKPTIDGTEPHPREAS